MINLGGKVAIIAGGGSGLGAATAQLMAQLGASVVIGDIVLSQAEKIAGDIDKAGGTAAALSFDLHDADSISKLVDRAAAIYGRLDIFHANAADMAPEVAVRDTDVVNTPTEVWDRIFHGNARGTMLCSKYAIPHMLRNGGGSIINTGSSLSLRGNLGQIAYSSSKATIIQITRSIAASHGKRGIRANVVLPGITLTDYVKSHVPQALFDIMLGETLDKELGQPADIANAVVFLASDAARHINGHILVVDGGESVHAPNIAALARLGSDMGMQEYQKL